MAASKEELLKRLSDGVLEMEEDDVEEAAKEYLEAGYPAFDGIMEGLVDGMNRASELYEAEEYFVTDVLLCSDAMYVGLDILRPHLPEVSNDAKVKGVIGVVEGDRQLSGQLDWNNFIYLCWVSSARVFHAFCNWVVPCICGKSPGKLVGKTGQDCEKAGVCTDYYFGISRSWTSLLLPWQ